jgi:MEMO1 family protein
MTTIRYPAVAGQFYPENPETLRQTVTTLLQEANNFANLPTPKAIIAPHAGYIYSGPIAASAYACLKKAQQKISKVVILAPAHRYPVAKLAATNVDVYTTPLGNINVDKNNVKKIMHLPQIDLNEEAFAQEHAIEVQLPFLQIALGNFELTPILVGNANVVDVVAVLQKVWGGEETLIVISSDLSHYYDYETAKTLDNDAATAIVNLKPSNLKDEQACGYIPIKGLLAAAANYNLQATLVDLRNSGDTAGPKTEVVGYGAFHFLQKI